MRSTLAFCAFMCLLVWGGMRGWEAYQRGWPPLDAAEWQMDKGNYEKALPYFVKAAEQEPSNLRIRIKLADCFDRLGNKQLAAQLYRESTEMLNDRSQVGLSYYRDRFGMLQSLGY
jgi:tetratricopeptide (TPR) repeat protein